MKRSRLVCFVAIAGKDNCLFAHDVVCNSVTVIAGVSLICCGQFSLLVWIDSAKSVTSRKPLDDYLIVPANEDPLKNSSVHTTYKLLSAKASTPVSSDISTMADSSNTVMACTGTAATSDPVRVKNLYDSDLILSHGVKLKWIRNRMMA